MFNNRLSHDLKYEYKERDGSVSYSLYRTRFFFLVKKYVARYGKYSIIPHSYRAVYMYTAGKKKV